MEEIGDRSKARRLVDYIALNGLIRRNTTKHSLSVQGLKRLCNRKKRGVKCRFVCKDVMSIAVPKKEISKMLVWVPGACRGTRALLCKNIRPRGDDVG